MKIETDTKWLEHHGICDYSFLIGHHCIAQADPEDLHLLLTKGSGYNNHETDQNNYFNNNNNHSHDSNSTNSNSNNSNNSNKNSNHNNTSQFSKDFGGIISQDQSEIYFMGIIDTFTTWDYRKMGEHLAKSLFHDTVSKSSLSFPHLSLSLSLSSS